MSRHIFSPGAAVAAASPQRTLPLRLLVPLSSASSPPPSRLLSSSPALRRRTSAVSCARAFSTTRSARFVFSLHPPHTTTTTTTAATAATIATTTISPATSFTSPLLFPAARCARGATTLLPPLLPLTQRRHATLLRRPLRPYTFTQLVVFSDGSAAVQRTTSPLPLFRCLKDARNAPLWNPSAARSAFGSGDDDENAVGRLRAFRRRFGRGWDADAAQAERAHDERRERVRARKQQRQQQQRQPGATGAVHIAGKQGAGSAAAATSADGVYDGANGVGRKAGEEVEEDRDGDDVEEEEEEDEDADLMDLISTFRAVGADTPAASSSPPAPTTRGGGRSGAPSPPKGGIGKI